MRWALKKEWDLDRVNVLTHKSIYFDIAKFPQVSNHDSLITPAIHRTDAQYLVLTDSTGSKNYIKQERGRKRKHTRGQETGKGQVATLHPRCRKCQYAYLYVCLYKL